MQPTVRLVLPVVLVLTMLPITACGAPASTPTAAVASSSASIDPLCSRIQGIYGSWAAAWQRDVDRRIAAGVDGARARQGATRSLTSPFRYAIINEIARDGSDAKDPALKSAMDAIGNDPEATAGYVSLGEACAAAGPFPTAR